MSVVRRFTDGLTNLVSNLGTSRDKAYASHYSAPVLTDQELINAYRGSWLPRKIVEAPVRDALRNWREWQLSPEDNLKVGKLEEVLGLRDKILEAKIKANLFGGAAVYIATNNTDTASPLNLNEKVRSLTVLTRRQLSATEVDLDPTSSYFGEPKSYRLANAAFDIHPTRLIKFIGKALPDSDIASAIELGWGDSVLAPVFQSLLNADSTGANITSLVFEAKIDIIKIPGFMAGLQDPEYEKRVLSRLTLANTAKGINGALMLDKEEEYDQKSANFSGLKDLWLTALQVCAGASDIPMTRLLGQSPGGLNATGDSDSRNYYDMVSSIQELDIQPAMKRFDDLLVVNALGRGTEAKYTWAPLWQPSVKERADIGKTIADTVKALADTNLFDDFSLGQSASAMFDLSGAMPGLNDISDPTGEEEEVSIEDTQALSDMEPASLYVSRKVLNISEIQEWAEEQGIELLPDLHVTILYCVNEVDWMKMGNSYAGEGTSGNIRIAAGGPRAIANFGDPGNTVVVLEFEDSDLRWRHEQMLSKGATHEWAYRPHVTLTKNTPLGLSEIEPYRGPLVLGPEIFEEIKV